MEQPTQDILKNLIRNHGISICSESKRLQGILQDLTSESKGKVKALVSVAEENVVSDLYKHSGGRIDYALYNRLVTRVQQNTAIEQNIVEWAIDCWIYALDKRIPDMPALPSGHSNGKIAPVTQTVSIPNNTNTSTTRGTNSVSVNQNPKQQSVTQGKQTRFQPSTPSPTVKKRNKIFPLIAAALLIIGVFTGGYKLFASGSSQDSSYDKEVASTNGVVEPAGGGDAEPVKEVDAGTDSDSTSDSGDYILSESEFTRLTESDLADLSLADLRLARNEIYARHGYVFKSEDLKSYFNQKSWYHEDPSFDESALSETEKYNAKFILSKEGSGYILSESEYTRLTESNLADLTLADLRLARNEIYARHGYIFKSEDLNSYFSKKSWYHPDASFDGSLSEIEKSNAELIQSRERSLQ
ncbi:YARHG domain-containing protein [Neobacillus drentensis]|uniref:YARHG domain-containing protein n=1 Tax=Neobacillus drentensis TaxID=220684 RepID=UPI001F3A7F0B|nr:YARHG domain-containing protein [Neobacillus drentensis]ULT56760.1 YARHG domain-containing protein [Neobacillus drentensis]